MSVGSFSTSGQIGDPFGRTVTNRSGGTVSIGDVVALDPENDESITWADSGDSRHCFVVTNLMGDAGASLSRVMVGFGGVQSVHVTGTVAIGDRLVASATDGYAKRGAERYSFATALQAQASGTGTIRAIITRGIALTTDDIDGNDPLF